MMGACTGARTRADLQTFFLPPPNSSCRSVSNTTLKTLRWTIVSHGGRTNRSWPHPHPDPEAFITHHLQHRHTLPVPALWDVGLRRVVPLPRPPRNPPRKLRPRRKRPDTPKVSVLSFLSSAHVVRLELKHRWVCENGASIGLGGRTDKGQTSDTGDSAPRVKGYWHLSWRWSHLTVIQ